jgi:hypothetical protein
MSIWVPEASDYSGLLEAFSRYKYSTTETKGSPTFESFMTNSRIAADAEQSARGFMPPPMDLVQALTDPSKPAHSSLRSLCLCCV